MARARLSMCEPASNRKGKLMKRSLGIYSYCNTARKLRSERAFKVLFMSQAGCAQSFPSRVLSALAWTDTVSSPGMTTGPGVWLRLCLWGHDHHGLQVGSQLMFPFPPSCNRQTLSHSPCIQTAASLSLSHTHTHTHTHTFDPEAYMALPDIIGCFYKKTGLLLCVHSGCGLAEQ